MYSVYSILYKAINKPKYNNMCFMNKCKLEKVIRKIYN